LLRIIVLLINGKISNSRTVILLVSMESFLLLKRIVASTIYWVVNRNSCVVGV